MTAPAPWPAVGAIALALLAGCTGHSASLPPAAPATSVNHIELSGCDGLVIALAGPAALYPGSVPPGWESGEAVTTVHVEAERCQRLSWGPFERGPIDILQEWHEGFAAPGTCSDPSRYDLDLMLQSIWFSDPEVAAYARDAHGMPALAATFGRAEQDLGAVRRWTWSWSVPGHPESRVEFDEGPETNRTTEVVQRVFWPDGGGVGFLDESVSYEGKDLSRLAAGTLQAPLLHGRAMPEPGFAAPATREAHASASATIARFRDTACLEPA